MPEEKFVEPEPPPTHPTCWVLNKLPGGGGDRHCPPFLPPCVVLIMYQVSSILDKDLP